MAPATAAGKAGAPKGPTQCNGASHLSEINCSYKERSFSTLRKDTMIPVSITEGRLQLQLYCRDSTSLLPEYFQVTMFVDFGVSSLSESMQLIQAT